MAFLPFLPAVVTAAQAVLGRRGGGGGGQQRASGPGWGPALAAAATSAAGGWLQNRWSAAEASRNRSFQERMSSTAAQRSVEDYRAAGLNPALAYDRPASSPGGSVAPVEDFVGKGVSSAMSAKMMSEQLQLTREQVREASGRANIAQAEGQVALAKAAPWSNAGVGSLRDLYGKAESARLAQEMALQPFQLSQLQALSQLTGAQVPGAQAEAELWKKLDQLGPVAKGILPLLRLIRPR